MWIEIEILREKDAPDWAEMGVRKPKNYTPETIVVRRMVWGDNIVWIEEASEGSLIRMLEETDPIHIKNNYQDLRGKLESIEPEDLEV